MSSTETLNEMEVTVSNTHATQTLFVTRFQVRGQALVEQEPFYVIRKDDASVLRFKRRPYRAPPQFLNTIRDVNSHANFLLRLLSEPQLRGTVLFDPREMLAAGERPLDQSDRVTVNFKGVSEEMFVEGVGHVFGRGGRYYQDLLLAPAGVYGQVIQLDVGPGLGTGILAI